MKLNLLLLLVLGTVSALAACSSIPEIRVPERVLVPTPIACVDPAKRPPAPQLRAEADLLAMDQYRRTLAVWQDLKKHEAYMVQLEAIVEGCSRLTPSSPIQRPGA